MRVQSLGGEWLFREASEDRWLPAEVPGGVHTDLLSAGRIPDPFVGDEEKRVQWVAERDWVYLKTFELDGELWEEDQILLVCGGLDTLAEVRLNGRVLGETANMFRQHEWEVTSLLRDGPNELVIDFRSPVRYITELQDERPLWGVLQAIPGGPHLRKAPCQFGWDWGPQLPPVGIWKEIWLEGRSTARFADVHLRQRHGDRGVVVSARVTVERYEEDRLRPHLRAQLRVVDPEGAACTASASLEGDVETVEVAIDRPELWWPNGLGEQPLYEVTIELFDAGTICDRRTYQLGLRTLELRQEEDEWGESFTFVVNGVPVFAKGSNWIPADAFPTRISDEQLEHLIWSAAVTHQNMLRVWGGGFYEDDRFYDLCDEYGILVWQDCIFSCSMYPLDEPAFLEDVHAEIIDNVCRLRHRASLALWCGNNEMEWGWDDWGWDTPHNVVLKEAYDRFFHRLLPEWCAEHDPDHPYWPSSPSSGDPFQDPNGQEKGDAHYWDVWHGRRPFTAYRDQYPRFMSEFGFQSLPPLETIASYAVREDWNMTSYIMEHHQRSGSGNGLMVAQMTDTFRMPNGFPSLVYLSMVLQAEGIRYGVEHWRRSRHRVSGTLYWQTNDCWPVASWSSLDYYGRWKALHYAARRFYAPLLLSIEDEGTWMSVHVTNDETEAWHGKVRWALETLEGEVVVQRLEEVSAAPLSSTQVCSLDFVNRVNDENRRDVIFVADLWDGDERVATQVAPFVPNKHLALVDPELSPMLVLQDDQLVCEVTATSLARFVELSLVGADVVWSDNYFDVLAGRTPAATCPLPDGWTLERAQEALRVRSLWDSFV